jgi:hypothetical protein
MVPALAALAASLPSNANVKAAMGAKVRFGFYPHIHEAI